MSSSFYRDALAGDDTASGPSTGTKIAAGVGGLAIVAGSWAALWFLIRSATRAGRRK